MTGVPALLARNRNYRRTWIGQVVSEVGDYFNNVAVLALAMEKSGSGLVVSGVLLSRAIPAVAAAPVAGVLLDRFDRRTIMVASDLVRALVAAGFLLAIHQPRPWLLYALSAVLMFASPFFTSGRAAILPSIASPDELHAANSLTQITSWATASVGALAGGYGAAKLGYGWAFVANALSFLVSAACVWGVRVPGGLRAARAPSAASTTSWQEYREGLAYIWSVPLMLGIAVISFGWALGGGAAQVLFALFGETVFHRGPAGIGSAVAYVAGRRIGFAGYKRLVTLCYVTHGVTYMLFSQAGSYPAALLWMMLSRAGMAAASVMNTAQLLRHTPDRLRGRVFSTMESVRWSVMIVSMAAAGIASQHYGPRTIGLVAGAFGVVTALGWAWCDRGGRIQEPSGGASANRGAADSPAQP
jgi:MFS family permease